MMKRILLLAVLCLSALTVFAGEPKLISKNLIKPQEWGFLENRGQLADENGNVIPDVKFYGHQGGMQITFRQGMISFYFSKFEADSLTDRSEADLPAMMPSKFRAPKSGKTTVQRMDLVLAGGNPNARLVATDRQDYYENYYLAHTPEQGITNVHTYKTLTYHDIYPNIDMVLHALDEGMKYEFVVRPGGRVSDIKMRWAGTDKTELLSDGGIRYTCGLGELKEGKSVSFIQGGKPVDSRFVKNGDVIEFEVGSYNRGKVLVIDPTLVWSTYLGGKYDDYCFDVATDGQNNAYITGKAGNSGIATPGAYLTTWSGGAYLAKYAPFGGLSWCTYYSGGYGYGINVDPINNVYITGVGGPNTSNGACFLAKFSSKGMLIWSTMYGGRWGTEIGYAVTSDKKGEVYITGEATSTEDVASSRVYQTNHGGGSRDAFLAKFSSTGNLIWSTYFGGNADDYGMSAASDDSGNVFITGWTASDSGISSTSAHQTNYGGHDFDAFIAKFSSSGSRLWSTYFGGNYQDHGEGIITDPSGNVLITGYTGSSNNIATTGSFKDTAGGSFDAFLTKFSPSGKQLWGTYFGSTDQDQSFSIDLDQGGNIYIGGMTWSQTFGSLTSGAYQTKNNGCFDGFFVKLDSIGFPKYSTFFGGAGCDFDGDVAVDKIGNVYIVGGTYSTSGISTPNAYQSTHGGGTIDSYLAKFSFQKNDAGVKEVLPLVDTLCSGVKELKIKVKNYGINDIDSVKIGWSLNSEIKTSFIWKGKLHPDSITTVSIGRFEFPAGSDTVKVWTYLPNGQIDSVPENDSAMIIDSFYAQPKAFTGGNKVICAGDSVYLGADSVIGHIYQWTSLPAGFTSTLPNPVVAPDSNITYYLTEIDTLTGCSRTDSAVIKVNPRPVFDLGADKTICKGQGVQLGTLLFSDRMYEWSSKPAGFYSTKYMPGTVYPQETTVYYLKETMFATGCSYTDSIIITVNESPMANTGPDQTICQGDKIRLGAAAIPGHTYSWTSHRFDFVSDTANPVVSPKFNTQYYLTETITATGCSKKDTVNITVNPISAEPVLSFRDTAICYGQGLELKFKPISGISYRWTSIPAGFSTSDSLTRVSPASSTMYLLSQKVVATGCLRVDTIRVTVNSLPEPDISGQRQSCVRAREQYQVPVNSGHQYFWQVNKGHIITGQNTGSIVVQWDSAGMGAITVTDKNGKGCTAIDTFQVNIDPLPVAFFYYVPVCWGSPIKFYDNSRNAVSRKWYFGDGNVSTQKDPSYTYSSPGNYNVRLIASSLNGCADTVEMVVMALSNPPTNWTIRLDTGRTIRFQTPVIADNAYHWDLGDGTTVAENSGIHQYSKDGTYHVSLTATDSNGCISRRDTILNFDYKCPNGVVEIAPNPFQDYFTLKYSLCQAADVQVSVTDELGRVLQEQGRARIAAGNYELTSRSLPAQLSSAIYFVRFVINNEVKVYKVLRVR